MKGIMIWATIILPYLPCMAQQAVFRQKISICPATSIVVSAYMDTKTRFVLDINVSGQPPIREKVYDADSITEGMLKNEYLRQFKTHYQHIQGLCPASSKAGLLKFMEDFSKDAAAFLKSETNFSNYKI